MRIHTHLIGLLAVVGSVLAGSADLSRPPSIAGVLTLDDAIGLALARQPSLTAAGARVDAAGGRAWQAGRWSNPELVFQVEEWPVSNGGQFSDAKQTIGVAQELPWPGKKKLDRQIGASDVRFSQAGLDLYRLELVRDVKAAFSTVLALDRSVEVGEELALVAESSAESSRKRVEAGATAYQEQLRAEIQLEQARSELDDLRLEAVAARETLALLLNVRNLEQMRIEGSLAEQPEDRLLQASVADWIHAHPSMVAARARVDRAELGLRRARLQPYPDVTAAVSGGRLGETDQSIVQFGFAIPLPLLDSAKGHKAEAFADIEEADAELAVVRRELERAWAVALKRYQAASSQVEGYRQRILPKADEALRLVQTGFADGKFGLIDLLDTQRTTAETQLTYQRKLLQLAIARAELEALFHPPVTQP
jgi:cobalt-zinc-cadmium efflux system outer membrane protein